METILVIVCVILGLVVVYFFRKSRETSYYRRLFELGDIEYKKSQIKIQDLLSDQGTKDVLLDRSSQVLEINNTQIQDLKNEKLTLQQSLEFQQEQYATLIGQKKSSEVRLGQISEQLAPFLSDFPFDPKRAKFLGDPIDMVCFESEKIIFVEIKSGKSQLSKRQREIRDQIKEGKVDFFVYRIDGK